MRNVPAEHLAGLNGVTEPTIQTPNMTTFIRWLDPPLSEVAMVVNLGLRMKLSSTDHYVPCNGNNGKGPLGPRWCCSRGAD